MKRPCIFVSSTCYDLRQIRGDLRLFVDSLGYEAVLSEFNTFPVHPEAGTIDNCLKAVQEKADIFVLIVGKRYGSLSSDGKSVTNLEYLTARAKSIPTYVFVLKSVLEVLPLWKANPQKDFSYISDSPKLLEFVETLKAEADIWIFPFETSSDISEVLRTQWAYLFLDALQLRLRVEPSMVSAPGLRDLQGPGLRLLIERPLAWEYRLFGQELENNMVRLGDLKRDWVHHIATGKPSVLNAVQLVSWIGAKIPEGRLMASNLETIFNEAWPDALGAPGASGDPESLVHTAKKVANVYKAALEWKLDFNCLIVPKQATNLKIAASNLMDDVVLQIEKFVSNYNKQLAAAVSAIRTGQTGLRINMRIAPELPGLPAFQSEMQRVSDLVASGKLS
jgi:hypothetical protein